MHVLVSDILGNPNVGLYCYCNDKYCLVPIHTSDKQIKEIQEALKVDVHPMSIAGTNLLGAFLAGNNDMLLVPEVAFDHELKSLKELNINFTVIKSRLTALGNNILCTSKGAVVNPDYSDDDLSQIKKALGIPVRKLKIAGLEIVGSLAVAGEKGCFACEMPDEDAKLLAKALGVRVMYGTVNFGSPYISSGIAANSNGFIIGDLSGGPEIANADEALGFLEEKNG